jgi:hypothetical protein
MRRIHELPAPGSTGFSLCSCFQWHRLQSVLQFNSNTKHLRDKSRASSRAPQRRPCLYAPPSTLSSRNSTFPVVAQHAAPHVRNMSTSPFFFFRSSSVLFSSLLFSFLFFSSLFFSSLLCALCDLCVKTHIPLQANTPHRPRDTAIIRLYAQTILRRRSRQRQR